MMTRPTFQRAMERVLTIQAGGDGVDDDGGLSSSAISVTPSVAALVLGRH
jgi:hypothetical protein